MEQGINKIIRLVILPYNCDSTFNLSLAWLTSHGMLLTWTAVGPCLGVSAARPQISMLPCFPNSFDFDCWWIVKTKLKRPPHLVLFASRLEILLLGW